MTLSFSGKDIESRTDTSLILKIRYNTAFQQKLRRTTVTVKPVL